MESPVQTGSAIYNKTSIVKAATRIPELDGLRERSVEPEDYYQESVSVGNDAGIMRFIQLRAARVFLSVKTDTNEAKPSMAIPRNTPYVRCSTSGCHLCGGTNHALRKTSSGKCKTYKL